MMREVRSCVKIGLINKRPPKARNIVETFYATPERFHLELIKSPNRNRPINYSRKRVGLCLFNILLRPKKECEVL